MSSNGNCESPSLVLGDLSLWVLEQAFPESDERYDGIVLRVRAECTAPGSTVTTSGPLLSANDLGRLLAGMEAMYKWEISAVEMIPLEPNLRVRLTKGARGDLEIDVRITPDHMTQEHRFLFTADLTYLPVPIEQCREIVRRFPETSWRSYPVPRPS